MVIRAAESKLLPPHTQTLVRVQGEVKGNMFFQPQSRLYERNYLVYTNSLVNVGPNRPFIILVENFSNVLRKVTKGQVIATAIRPPTQLMKTTATLVALLGEEATPRERLELLHFNMPSRQATPPEEPPTTLC